MFTLLILLIQLVNSFNFDHPQTPTVFYWRISDDCLSHCQLNVTNLNTSAKMNFSPNTRYLSCEYLDDYQWQINCDQDRYCKSHENEKSYLSIYAQSTVYATKNLQTNKKRTT